MARLAPFGIGHTKPKHFATCSRWSGKPGQLGYAWKVLSRGVCDGCALGLPDCMTGRSTACTMHDEVESAASRHDARF